MKTLRRIVVLLLLLTAVGAGALWFATRSAPRRPVVTQTPATSETPAPDEPSGDPDILLRRLQRDGRITVGAEELTALTRTWMSTSPEGREFLRVSRDLEAVIDPEFVEVGGTFDLAELDESRLGDDAREAVEQMRATVPFLLNGERYLGVRGMPRPVAGNLGFGPDASVRIGTLGLPVGLLTFLGSEEEIANASLELPDLYVTEVTIDGTLLTVEAHAQQR